jgi:hypothetical protein
MRRRWLWPIGLSTLPAVTVLLSLGAWPFDPDPPPPPIPVPECGEEAEPKMTPAQYRYLHSQTRHWRAIMLKR